MAGSGSRESLSIRDNRTGQEYEVDILDGNVIRAMDLRQIKVDPDEFGMMSYDPAFTNTVSTRSTVTEIDGGKGILRYRGYPIEQLAKESTFLEVAYLILKGELPAQAELDDFVREVTHHTYTHKNLVTLMGGFRYDAHTMGMMISAVGGLSTFYPDAKAVDDVEGRRDHIIRLVAKGKPASERSSSVSRSSNRRAFGPITLNTDQSAVTSVGIAWPFSGRRRRIQSKSRTAWAAPVTMKKASGASRVTVRSDSIPPLGLSIVV